MESVNRVVKKIHRSAQRYRAERYEVILEEIKLSAQARCDFEQVELTIKRGRVTKKVTSHAPNTLGTKAQTCVFDDGYSNKHSLYTSRKDDIMLPKKLQINVKGIDKEKRHYNLGYSVVDISKYKEEPQTCI